jgi:glucosamine--fructose-6-phosphate aminotransferase (isomerizing)
MQTLGQQTFNEIFSQPDLWKQALDIFDLQHQSVLEFYQQSQPEKIILTGCGSTYYLSTIGAWLIQEQTGIRTIAYPASELLLFPNHFFLPSEKTLLIMVSRSGTTRETVEAARLFKEYGTGQTLAITCHSESVLAQEANFVLAIDEAREQSPVQTRSFSSMAVLMQSLASALGKENEPDSLYSLPDALTQLLEHYHALAKELGSITQFNQFVFLGTGALYGVACEAMLKMAEMALIPSVAYHAMEFRHGPRYAVNDKTMVIALLDENLRDEEIRALHDAQHFGATLVCIGEHINKEIETIGTTVKLQSNLSVLDRTILYLPFLQLIGYYQAITRGYDPDKLRERAPKS